MCKLDIEQSSSMKSIGKYELNNEKEKSLEASSKDDSNITYSKIMWQKNY